MAAAVVVVVAFRRCRWMVDNAWTVASDDAGILG
jgi:hypothetical protein